jgi:allophanate hydrolase subunit 2
MADVVTGDCDRLGQESPLETVEFQPVKVKETVHELPSFIWEE